MNRKNYRNNRVLLDTSFLLPILGFETSKEIMNVFEKLMDYTLFYNEISILEALWKIVKIKLRDDEIKRVLEGINSIRRTMDNIPLDDDTVGNAINMYKLGHRDIVDNLLYSAAVSRDLKFLTVDRELIEFINRHRLPNKYIILPKDIMRGEE